MELKLGERISSLRRAKGMTQEQLANAVGVSAPAVSKWETNSSYPDFTLLCPLARALDTDVDALLSFEATLSAEAAQEKINAVVKMAFESGASTTEAELRALLHRYPNCAALKFYAVTALDLLDTSFPDFAPERMEARRQWKRALMADVRASGDAAYWQAAVGALAAYAVSDGELDRAEALLAELPEHVADATVTRVRLYLARNQREQAVEALQKRMYVLVNQLFMCMSQLVGPDVEPDARRALRLAEVGLQASELFGVGGTAMEGLMVELYRRAGMDREALAQMSRAVERFVGPVEVPSPLLFSTLVRPENSQARIPPEALRLLRKELEAEPFWQAFREEPLYREALAKLRAAAPERDSAQ